MPKHINPHLLAPANRYFTQAWRKRARAQLQREPLCRMCAQKGPVVPATVADHVAGHEPGETWEQWLLAPLASLCKPCHDGPKRQVERLGYSTEMGVDGWPIDPNHPTNLRRSR